MSLCGPGSAWGRAGHERAGMANHVTADLLERSDLFRGIGADGLSAATETASRLLLRTGAQLLKQGDPPRQLFLLEHGRIKMTVVTAQLTLRFMRDGDVVGCAAVFRGMAYPATATALEETSVLFWSAAQINDLVSRFPRLAANALAIVSGRADEFLQRLRETATERVEQRLARAIADGRCERRGRLIGGSGTRHGFPAATCRNCKHESFTVSRTVSEWSRQGIVMAGRGKISICDRQRLAAIARTGTTK
jgi:CRP/FNR family transcriptional regulator, nitrogen oxide reductase regulator